jgi:hypothetical protein
VISSVFLYFRSSLSYFFFVRQNPLRVEENEMRRKHLSQLTVSWFVAGLYGFMPTGKQLEQSELGKSLSACFCFAFHVVATT